MKNKFILGILLILNSIVFTFGATGDFNACGNIQINQPWFDVKDSLGNDVLIIDNEGDIFFLGESHANNTASINSLDTIEIFSNFFNKDYSYFTNLSENIISFPTTEKGVWVQNDVDENVTFIAEDGKIYTKGKAVYQGGQGNCLADGTYCSGENVEDRDYFCDIIGVKNGACKINLTSLTSTSCADRRYCNGKDVWFEDNSCGGSPGSASCVTASNRRIIVCNAAATRYTGWVCDGSTRLKRTITTYTPYCNGDTNCANSPSYSTQYSNCASNQYCSGNRCITRSYDIALRRRRSTYEGCRVCGGSAGDLSYVPGGRCAWYTTLGGTDRCASGYRRRFLGYTNYNIRPGTCSSRGPRPGTGDELLRYRCY